MKNEKVWREKYQIKTTVTIDGKKYWHDYPSICMAVVPGSKMDTSYGKVGIHHYSRYDADQKSWEYVRTNVLPKLWARQSWVDRAIERRHITCLDQEAMSEAQELVEKIKSGAWGGYDKLPKTIKERDEKMKLYNDIVNEGGEGYVPWTPSKEDYNNAIKALQN